MTDNKTKILVTFTETYKYTKEIEIKDGEDIDEVIHDPLYCPTIRDMSDDEYSNLDIDVNMNYEY